MMKIYITRCSQLKPRNWLCRPDSLALVCRNLWHVEQWITSFSLVSSLQHAITISVSLCATLLLIHSALALAPADFSCSSWSKIVCTKPYPMKLMSELFRVQQRDVPTSSNLRENKPLSLQQHHRAPHAGLSNSKRLDDVYHGLYAALGLQEANNSRCAVTWLHRHISAVTDALEFQVNQWLFVGTGRLIQSQQAVWQSTTSNDYDVGPDAKCIGIPYWL
jgi:hypothetical protein